ncbi:MAG: hypothetical protein IKE81_09290 [Clostridia bacterium]|nr:hypothetical protein [Clostridia bacterium]
MFQEVKAMLPISGDDYDAEIITQIKAAALDLTTSAEIVLPGVISITRTQSVVTHEWVVTDNSTLTDELIITAIGTWCNMRIGNPPNYDQLLKAYNSLKGQLRLSKTYTHYNGEETAE